MDTSFADPVGAFVPHGRTVRPPHRPGPLDGLKVAVKDLYDWKGVPTGAGNPDWLKDHPVPERDAVVLTQLLDAGATLFGKTVTDELAYSIHGDNVHYGTPVNTAAPGRVPGGSSSGSAAAVAGGLADAALGTDTGGSVRVPAAYCGIFGLRTTHGALDETGLIPLAPSFDTVGWFGRTPEMVGALAAVLLGQQEAERDWERCWTLPEADQLVDTETHEALAAVRRRLGLAHAELDGLTDPFGGLEGLRRAYVSVQAFEAWESHGPWIQSRRPRFGTAVSGRFEAASRVTPEEAALARRTLERFRAALRAALGSCGVLLIASAPGPAPATQEIESVVEQIRVRTMRLTCPAGLAGLPQITIPLWGGDGLPRGVGLVGPAHSDRALVTLAGLAVREA